MEPLSAEENNFLRVTELVQTLAPTALRPAFVRAWNLTYPDTPWNDIGSAGKDIHLVRLALFPNIEGR